MRFDTWTTEDGLPQNSVNDIIQTRDGYLWLATFGGLVRFDGARFTVFDRSVEGIGSQRVRCLLEQRDGTLWAATEDGMLIRYRDGAFATYGAWDGLPNAQALRIDEDADRNLWVTWIDLASQEGIVTRHDGTGVEVYRPGDLPRDVAPTRLHQGQHDIWWSRDVTGLYCLLKGRVTPCVPGDALPAGEVVRVVTDDHDCIWVVVDGAGVLRVSSGGSRIYTTEEGVLGGEAISWYFEDRQATVWFAATEGKLFVASGAVAELVSSVPALAIFQDHEGSIWVGSTLGLSRVRRPAIAMRDVGDGLSSNLVYSILQDRAGTVWVGTWGGGVNRYEAGRFTAYGDAQGLPSGLVTSLLEDRSGRLWVGTMKGLRFMEGNRFSRVRGGAALEGAVWAIQEDRAGTLWFATDSGLLSLRGERLDEYTSANGLPHDRVTALAEGRSGALWIGTFRGLARLQSGVLTAYTERDGFVGSWVRALHEDADGVLWIGTYDGGLYRMKAGQLTRYTTKHGLHDNGVFQILEDDLGYFWMGSNRGISRVSRRDLNDFADGRITSVRSRVFGTRDGMSTLECNGGRQPGGLKAADGTLWFPTMGGVAIVDPRAVPTPSGPPPVIVEELLVSGEPVDLGGEVTIPREAGSFEFRYTAASFGAPEQLRFRHKLEGLDEEWTDAGGRRMVAYHGVPPGRYRFLVMAANEDGDWNASGAQAVGVVVLAPFWRQTWFVALVVFSAFLAAAILDRRRVAGHRRERARQTAFAQRLIETQEGERQRISTELHDALGQELFVIRAHVRSARATGPDMEAVGQALDAIDGVARKASEGLREIAHALRPYHLDKIGLSRTVEEMARSIGQACGIDLTTEIADVDDALDPTQQIHAYRIVQECVSNVVKHSGAAHARVTMEIRSGVVELRVEDDGIGFQPGAKDLAERANRGLGLMGIRERAKWLGGEAHVQSTMGQGTVVVVSFPIDRRDHGR